MAEAEAGPALRLRGLSKRFGRRWALREVDLELPRGAFLALLGPNGAGKTTLLRVLATLLKPTSGDAEVLGLPVRQGADEIRRRAGLLTADGFLYDDLTAAENLRFAALMSGDRPDRAAHEALLARVGLSDAADVRVRAFSTGMRRRLELARLLLRRPELVLMDEPYVSLDEEGVALVDRTFRELRERGATVVFASHQRDEARRVADRAVVLRRGRVEG